MQVRKCTARDTSGGRCDSLEIEFENAGGWYSWGPQEDDKILVSHNGYDTGIMYLNTVLPESGRYRIMATSLPCKARAKENRSFYQRTIEEIMRACAMESGMDFGIYGIDAGTIIPYVQRENEGCAAFLHRLLRWEGASLKCVNGKYTAIGLIWAQNQEPSQSIELSAKQRGTEYWRNGRSYKALTVKSPYAEATAEDLSVGSAHTIKTVNGLPVMNNIQAGRWARGLLLDHNRGCESLGIQSDFNPAFSAMARIDITGGTDATGEWLVEEAEHDFKNLTSTARMRRCIQTIQ